MLNGLQSFFDKFFGISSRHSSFIKELNAASYLTFNSILWTLLVCGLLYEQKFNQTPHPADLMVFSISVALLTSLVMRSTLVACPSLTMALYTLYYFLSLQGWTWNMLSLALSLAVFSYWLLYLLGQTEKLQQLIPENLVDAVYVGILLMLFFWCISALDIAQLKTHNIIALKVLNARIVVVLVGMLLYAVYVWKPWPGGWWMSFLVSLIMFFCLQPCNRCTTGAVLDFSALFPQWNDKEAFKKVLTPSCLPNILGLSLLVFILFHNAFSYLKEAKDTQANPSKTPSKNNMTHNLPILAISLALFLGLGFYRLLKDPFNIKKKEDYSGFCGFMYSFFMSIAWLYLDYLLCIPFLILLIPMSAICLKSIIDLFLPLFKHKSLCVLLPNLMAIILIPITFNLSFSVAISLLIHLVLSCFRQKSFKQTLALMFLILVCLTTLVF